jgi:hypothetical protein
MVQSRRGGRRKSGAKRLSKNVALTEMILFNLKESAWEALSSVCIAHESPSLAARRLILDFLFNLSEFKEKEKVEKAKGEALKITETDSELCTHRIQFRLSKKQMIFLNQFRLEGESSHMAAKRIVLSSLSGDRPTERVSFYIKKSDLKILLAIGKEDESPNQKAKNIVLDFVTEASEFL